MPALPPVPSTARIQFLWDVGADLNVSTTLYWAYTGGSFNSANAASMANAIAAEYGATQQAMHGSQVKMVGVRVTDLASQTAGDATAETNLAGTRTGGDLPASTCAVVNYTINRRYRGGKPKSFLPWGMDGDLAGPSTWTSGFITSADNAWTTLYGYITGASAGGATLSQHVAVSYYSGFRVVTSPSTGRARNMPTPRATPETYTVSNTQVASYLGSQRRRIRG